MKDKRYNIIYLLDKYVERLEDEGYPYVEIIDALVEYTEIATELTQINAPI
tara:strand:+ start:391 stop:543 length:153 start_codon:yes stop_codon:yes gene_type:complete